MYSMYYRLVMNKLPADIIKNIDKIVFDKQIQYKNLFYKNLQLALDCRFMDELDEIFDNHAVNLELVTKPYAEGRLDDVLATDCYIQYNLNDVLDNIYFGEINMTDELIIQLDYHFPVFTMRIALDLIIDSYNNTIENDTNICLCSYTKSKLNYDSIKLINIEDPNVNIYKLVWIMEEND